MSVIAAKVYNDKVVMAADSIIVTGWSKRNNNFSKIVEINNMIMGSTGYCQECSIMWHYMQTHKPASSLEKDILASLKSNNYDFNKTQLIPLVGPILNKYLGTGYVDKQVQETNNKLLYLNSVFGRIKRFKQPEYTTYTNTQTTLQTGSYTIKDSNNNEIATFTLTQSYRGFMFYDESFNGNTTYILYKDETKFLTFSK